ncbi:MAG: MerR family transcriptional regulator [Alphaproteobacteria bacterium]|nr:MerR family transcriptional regulator [Alphaproteobacteria bacterium]
MGKKFDAYKTIGEVSKELNIPTHIIRFWETKFERLKLVKRKNNHRYYSKEDMIFILNIKKLVAEEGYTIKGVQKNLKNNKNRDTFNNEEEYLQLLNEIKTDINNIINSE